MSRRLIFTALLALAGCKQALSATPEEHGRYLVHDVAMCVQCHTPRTASGAVIPERLLSGAPMPLGSPFSGKAWAYRAPPLAGLPGFAGEDVITLLMTGQRRDGTTPLPPMPPYRMSRADAEAVVAYLRSLQ